MAPRPIYRRADTDTCRLIPADADATSANADGRGRQNARFRTLWSETDSSRLRPLTSLIDG